MNNDSNGNYQILQELGKGSYGVVYKVSCNGVIKVLKQIDINHISDRKQQDALKEVEILKQVNHPNIIKYHSSFINKGIINIIMEYAEQGDLMMYLKTQKINFPIGETFIWSIAYQLTEAIAHLHSRNIMHRDIKPLNIFLTKDHQIKLGDLGVSKIMNEQFPHQGTRVGTPLFLAPELVQHQPYDQKIDIWSLGCVLYFICTFRTPFYGENLIQLGYNIVNKQPKPINTIYTQKLQGFINKLLIKDPLMRPSIIQIQSHFQQAEYKSQQNQQIIYSSIHQIDNSIDPACGGLNSSGPNSSRVNKLIKTPRPRIPTPIHALRYTLDNIPEKPFKNADIIEKKLVPQSHLLSPARIMSPLRLLVPFVPKSYNIAEHVLIYFYKKLQKLKSQVSQPIFKKYTVQKKMSQEDKFTSLITKIGRQSEGKLQPEEVQTVVQSFIEKNEKIFFQLDSDRKQLNHQLKFQNGIQLGKVRSYTTHQKNEPNQGRSKEYVRVRFVRNIQNQEELVPKSHRQIITKKNRSQTPKKFIII